MAVSQSLYLTQESQDVLENSSRVRILWQSKQTGESYNITQRTAYYYVSINGGAETEYSVSYKLPLNTLQTIVDVTIDVPHSADGKGSVSVRTWMDTRISAGVVQLEKSLTLTQIARASTIGATDADIESTSSIIITPKSNTYTHSIRVQFGALSGYLLADGTITFNEAKILATSIAFNVPRSFYDQIPDSTSGVCTLTCLTYLGYTRIGEAQTTTFTVTASKAKCAPIVQYAITDTNAETLVLTGDDSTLVRYMSNARCSIFATSRNGASIIAKSIAGVPVTEDSRDLVGVESGAISFSATDSRGYTTSLTVTKDLIAYIKLTANVQLVRTDPTSGKAKLTITGDYFNGSFGASDNTLTLQYRVARSGATYNDYTVITPAIEGNAYSASIILEGLNYEYAYNVQVVATDKLSFVEKVAPVGPGIPVFDWGEKDFRFNVPVALSESCYGETLPDTGKKGQLFFQKSATESGYVIRIHNGISWQ